MKKMVAVVLMVLFVAGIAYAKNYEVAKKAGDFDVLVVIDKNPPVVGMNNVTVTVKDAAGKFVPDANVVVEYSMPPMQGMAPMNYKANATVKGSNYKAVMNLSMAGPWNIAVKIIKAGKTSAVKFTIDVQ
ncbi:MAG TPA: FixH family protein [Dissulfurispiraceae bacterium]|nr:FixH family protein [Dissulfurispiraceae bacterium]